MGLWYFSIPFLLYSVIYFIIIYTYIVVAQSLVLEVLVAQLCLTLCDPMDCSLTGLSPSMEFFRQGYCSGLPFPSPGELPDPGIEPRSPALQADSLPSELPGKPCSVAKSCPTFCDLMDCSRPGFPVFHYLLECAQTHIH